MGKRVLDSSTAQLGEEGIGRLDGLTGGGGVWTAQWLYGGRSGLGCDFFGSVTYTHIRVRRFAKFFPSHAKVSYAKVSYLRICYVKW
jgi:hypothetical protein